MQRGDHHLLQDQPAGLRSATHPGRHSFPRASWPM